MCCHMIFYIVLLFVKFVNTEILKSNLENFVSKIFTLELKKSTYPIRFD